MEENVESVMDLLVQPESDSGPNSDDVILHTDKDVGFNLTGLNMCSKADSVLHAVRANHLATLEQLLSSGYSPNSENGDEIAIHTTLRLGHSEALALLLSHKDVDLNIQTSKGITPLMEAINRGRSTDILVLLENGADVNVKNQAGEHALWLAVLQGNVEIASALIRRGAELCGIKADRFMRSLLHVAVNNVNAEMLELLLSSGCPTRCHNWVGQSPFDVALLQDSAQCVKALLAAGYLPSRPNRARQTPLHRCYSKQVAQVLLEAGADTNAKNSHSETPLHRAACLDQPNFVYLLLNHGANVNAAGAQGSTPLHAAARRPPFPSTFTVLNQLLTAGADPKQLNLSGWSPTDGAMSGALYPNALLLHSAAPCPNRLRRHLSNTVVHPGVFQLTRDDDWVEADDNAVAMFVEAHQYLEEAACNVSSLVQICCFDIRTILRHAQGGVRCSRELSSIVQKLPLPVSVCGQINFSDIARWEYLFNFKRCKRNE